MAVDRDYTDSALDAINDALDEYFSDDGEAGFFNQIFYKLGFFSFGKSGTKGMFDRYVKTLSIERDDAENKIVNTLLAVADVEQKYLQKFDTTKEQTSSYINMIKAISEGISFANFSMEYNFSSIIDKCNENYVNVASARIDSIIEKGPENWSDEDIEILSFTYMYSDDNEVKERILNSFYKETTEDHFINDCDNTFINGQRDLEYPYQYYDRYDVQWKKFYLYNRLYYRIEYEKYQKGCISEEKYQEIQLLEQRYRNGEIDENEYTIKKASYEEYLDEEMNQIIGNYLLIEKLNKDEYSVLLSDEELPVQLNEDNCLELTCPRFSKIYVAKDGSITGVTREGKTEIIFDIQLPNTVKNEKYEIYKIADGEAAEEYIYRENMNELVNVETYDYENAITSGAVSHMTNTANTLIPGSGKLFNYIQKLEEFNDGKEMKISRQVIEDYIDKFGVKMVHSSDGYQILPTRESTRKIERFMDFLTQNKDIYPNMYEKYVEGHDVYSYTNGQIGIEELISDIMQTDSEAMRNYCGWK